LLAETLGDRSLRILVSGGFAGIRMTHAVGDGAVFNSLVPELFGAGAAGRAPVLAFSRPTRLPLARAVLRFFGRDPRRVVAMLTTPRPVRPDAPADVAQRPWRPEVCAHYVRSSDALPGQLRAWRDRYLPGVSGAAVLFAAACAAFEECGLASADPGVVILIDARRYLSKSSTVDGNFAVGPYVVPADLRDPRAVQVVMDRALATGQALGVLAGRDLFSRGRRGQETDRPDQVSTEARPRLALTHIGRLASYAGLPWSVGPADRTVLSAPTPGAPADVTVSFAELAGVLHLNVVFHRSTFDEKAVRRAAELICTDPIGLVAGHGSAPREQDTAHGAVTGE
jgi:hypothetical protein